MIYEVLREYSRNREEQTDAEMLTVLSNVFLNTIFYTTPNQKKLGHFVKCNKIKNLICVHNF